MLLVEDDAALQQLQRYRWPGNIRELKNVLTQAIIRLRGARIDCEHLDMAVHADAAPLPDRAAVPASLAEHEAAHIHAVLGYCQGHKGNSCKILGISRPALDRKIERYGLTVPRPGK